ncbi:MAG: hypothetical protein HY717_15350 [Planctomycetes bacterium]|nr:hypothetical protein [Planctomycetota bacterium]
MAGKTRSQRLEEKRRRRVRRLERRLHGQDPIESLIRKLETHDVPPPSHWPGASDASLSHPDMLKFELTTFAVEEEPGRSKLKELEARCRRGPLAELPEIDHWVMEEFFWHGVPGDGFLPVEAFLAREGHRFTPAAQDQLRGWKDAKLGAFEVGDVDGETVALRPWDLLVDAPMGGPFRALTLNIGGVNTYTKFKGSITLTYVAPWAPRENLFCGMGYGITPARSKSGVLIPYLGLQHPEIAARPFPWKDGYWLEVEYLSRWKDRDWQSWLAERLEFPFWAVVPIPPAGDLKVLQVTGLLDLSSEKAREFGIYLECPRGKEIVLIGATAVSPVDIASSNTMLLAEYQTYRDRVGPPPGVRNGPNFLDLRRLRG